MASAPQIALRDGTGFTQALVFTTNQENIVLTGTVGTDTADIQVSVNGAPFVSDPTLVALDLLKFTVPNPASYPSGFALGLGLNTIALRTIDIVGGVSATSTAVATRVVRPIGQLQTSIPTGIRVRRRRDAVDLQVAKPTGSVSLRGTIVASPGAAITFLGFNIYAATSAAGGGGYFKINSTPITTGGVFEDDTFLSYNDTTRWAVTARQNVRIRVTEEDVFGAQLSERLNRVYDTSIFTGDARFTSTLESVVMTEFSSFRHYRTGGPGIINSDQFVGVLDSDPLYYVVTGLYFDTYTNQEVETSYSQEVLGTPLIIDTTIRDLPGRRQRDIQTSYVNQIVQVNTAISLNPGSTTRDVSIDPFASEAERLWFVIDFVHRSQSFLTLLQIDNITGSGTSDPVSSSNYKLSLQAALGLGGQDTAVQALIDEQFDKLAANCGKTRLSGRPAVGQAVVYTTRKPSTDITVPAGTFVAADADTSNNLPAVRYRIGGSYILPASNADAFYNFDTKRYEITVDLVAESVGTQGNRSAGSITSIAGVSGVNVTNTEATVFGTDRETNADLAARSELAFSSVDTGTEGGYASTSAEQIGIIKAKVVKSGDALMMRDYDDVRRKHIGGKVDIWTQGLRERQVTERFAFTFEIARDIQCQIIDLTTLTFRVLDSRVTLSTPIVEILNNPSQGLGVRNATTGESYDLTSVQILDYQTFRVNTSISQPVTMIDDVIVADYRFRIVNQFHFSLQPVRRVVAVVGEVSGALNTTLGYDLYKTDDPLLTGESTIAKDYLSINQVSGVPSGNSIPVNDEVHILIGSTQEPLDSIGINTKTLRVFNAARTVEYSGPSAAAPDFDIIDGTPTTPAKIVRVTTGTIANGQTVSVDYIHDENFTVTYVVNDLLQELQQTVNIKRHTTADVLVKQAIENNLDLETTAQLLKGSTKDLVDPLLRSNVSLELDRKTIGQGIAQSDVISVVDGTTGVDYSPVPYAKMAYADGARKLREGVLSTYKHMSSLDLGGNVAFILTNPLSYPTTDGGGTKTEHKGVFQDDESMALASSLTLVAQHANQAFILGAQGAVIAGYTDDATLTADGFTTAKDRAVELLRRTANHVVVSLSGSGLPPDNPANHLYAVSYVVRGDKGAHDIAAASVEYLALGNLTVSYRVAT
jgi:hypothetical protein